jgi:alkylated DNA nucleotide flippase Atl1
VKSCCCHAPKPKAKIIIAKKVKILTMLVDLNTSSTDVGWWRIIRLRKAIQLREKAKLKS